MMHRSIAEKSHRTKTGKFDDSPRISAAMAAAY